MRCESTALRPKLSETLRKDSCWAFWCCLNPRLRATIMNDDGCGRSYWARCVSVHLSRCSRRRCTHFVDELTLNGAIVYDPAHVITRSFCVQLAAAATARREQKRSGIHIRRAAERICELHLHLQAAGGHYARRRHGRDVQNGPSLAPRQEVRKKCGIFLFCDY